MHSKAALLALICLFTLNAAHTESNSSVLLKSTPPDIKLTLEKDKKIYGHCDGTVVMISGANPETFTSDGYFAYGLEDLGMQLTTRTKKISLDFALSDYNTVDCVETLMGLRLLVGSSCGGSVCVDNRNYQVIIPRTGSMFPGRNARKPCYANCVNRILGKKYLQE